MKKLIFISILVSTNAMAYTECNLVPNKIWLNNSGSTVWVCFDGGICIYKSDTQLSEAVMDRTFSLATAAILAGKELIVRFTDNSFDCSVVGSFNDYEGFWLYK